MTTTTPTPNPPISSEQARRLVDRFLLMEVSTMLAAATPELVLGARPIWRVPVWIGFLQQGRYTVGALDVDAQRGALLEREQGVAAIRARAGQITLQRMQTSTDLPGCCGVTGLSVAVSIRCSLLREACPMQVVGLTGGRELSILTGMTTTTLTRTRQITLPAEIVQALDLALGS